MMLRWHMAIPLSASAIFIVQATARAGINCSAQASETWSRLYHPQFMDLTNRLPKVRLMIGPSPIHEYNID